MVHVTRMLATSHQMVTFSSHSDNIWCVQPEDMTSVGQPRSHVPDGNSQMVSTNDTVEETWHNINITVSWITRFKRYVAKFRQDHACLLESSAKTWPTLGTTITWWHLIRPLSPLPLEYYSTIPGDESNPCPLAPYNLSNLQKAEYKITFFRIHPESFHEPDIQQEFLTNK